MAVVRFVKAAAILRVARPATTSAVRGDVYACSVFFANLSESDQQTGFRSFKRGICGVSRDMKNCAVSAVLGKFCACGRFQGGDCQGVQGFPEIHQQGLLRA